MTFALLNTFSAVLLSNFPAAYRFALCILCFYDYDLHYIFYTDFFITFM